MLKSQRTDITDPEFLTFRNNPSHNNENTGRSLFSQQFNNYKSLEKYQIAQSQQPVRNFRKKMKGVRSQQKNQRALLSELNILQSYNEQNSNESSNNELKNQILRKKLQRVVKKIKSQQRKQSTLKSTISELKKELIADEKYLQNQIFSIEQLQDIYDQNQDSIKRFEKKYEQQMLKNDKLCELLEEKEELLQNFMEQSMSIFSNNSNNSSNSNSLQYKSKEVYIQKLVNGLKQVQKMKDDIQSRYKRMQSQISKMRDYMQALKQMNSIINI